MKEIKFRQAIFDKDGKFLNWHYWGLIGDTFVSPSTGLCPPKEAVENSYQYTGFKDRKGKEIYDGAFIQFHISKGSPVVSDFEDQDPLRKSVYWDPEEADWTWKRMDGIPERSGFTFCKNNADTIMEVIGSIYENPELLK